ncbi:MAG: hypothetical protein IJ741_02555 [Schwartzia sp.]|nr:hypothetical protein [Schwartzia sp. (in: firmicutes)]
MNLLYIGKYPPLEGGTSVAAYWRMREYAAHGIRARAVTACRKGEHCLPTGGKNGATVVDSKMDWHIPYTQLFSERLVSSALSISRRFEVDVVEGNYLFPYGYAAYVVSLLLGRPLILRHAGSDLFRLGRNEGLAELLRKMLKSAKKIVTYEDCRDTWNAMGITKDNLYYAKRYVPNPKYFYPGTKSGNAAMFGKITDKWDNAQLVYYVSELKKRNFQGTLEIYSSSKRRDEIKQYFCENGIETSINDFLPPKKVCKVLSHASYALASEVPPNIIEQSNIAFEAAACQCDVLQRGMKWGEFNDLEQKYEEYIENQIGIYRM